MSSTQVVVLVGFAVVVFGVVVLMVPDGFGWGLLAAGGVLMVGAGLMGATAVDKAKDG